MCVIMCFEDTYPKKDILEQAENMNKDGGGMAWIENGKVCWVKGKTLNAKQIMYMIKDRKIKLPIVIHFRIATHGSVGDELCHPFALNSKNSEDIEIAGVSETGVLFHNGVWSDYDETALKTLISRNVQLPKGEWSDSRIMAWLVEHLGIDYLRLIDQKVTVLTPEGIKKYGKGWCEVDKITCSNNSFKQTFKSTTFKGKVKDKVKMSLDDYHRIYEEDYWDNTWNNSRAFFRGGNY